MLQKPGPDLDREVARRLGEKGAGAAPFSTDPPAAERLIARVERSGIFTNCEQAGTLWYCTLSTDIARVRERLATGTGQTRAEALCRALINLPADRLRTRPKEP